jgi:membrane-bound lytic murein transglycosylase B
MAFPRLLRATALAFALAAGAADLPLPPGPAFAARPEVQAFIQAMVRQHGLEADELSRLLDQTHPNAEAIALAAPAPGTFRRSWKAYHARFIEPIRIRAGVAFWREHRAALARAEKDYGVPAEIIVGILGVETLYGQRMGRFPVLEVLATLAFDYPEAPNKATRSAMFLQELEAFLVWCRDNRQDPLSYSGSYTGAIGLPQFLPSSLRTYAVDYDRDGQIDLRGSAEDAIGSVARYLHDQGWEAKRPVLWPLAPEARTALEARSDGDPEPKWTMARLLDAGIRPAGLRTAARLRAFRRKEGGTPVVLVDLPTPEQPTEYRAGLKNFYVLTRYNRSFFYAAAVYELGRSVKAALPRK